MSYGVGAVLEDDHIPAADSPASSMEGGAIKKRYHNDTLGPRPLKGGSKCDLANLLPQIRPSSRKPLLGKSRGATSGSERDMVGISCICFQEIPLRSPRVLESCPAHTGGLNLRVTAERGR